MCRYVKWQTHHGDWVGKNQYQIVFIFDWNLFPKTLHEIFIVYIYPSATTHKITNFYTTIKRSFSFIGVLTNMHECNQKKKSWFFHIKKMNDLIFVLAAADFKQTILYGSVWYKSTKTFEQQIIDKKSEEKCDDSAYIIFTKKKWTKEIG